MDLDKELSERLIGLDRAKIIIDRDDNVEIDGKRLQASGKWFNFHNRLMELAAFSPGSTYELGYKSYPPCWFEAIDGVGTLLDYWIPASDRFGPRLSSSGIEMYLCKSNMEKFKIFKGYYSNDFGHDREIRDSITEALREIYDYSITTKVMDIQSVFHSRKTYFGSTVSGPYNVPDYNLRLLTLPGIAVFGELKDKEKLKDDLSFWLLKNNPSFEDWKKQWD